MGTERMEVFLMATGEMAVAGWAGTWGWPVAGGGALVRERQADWPGAEPDAEPGAEDELAEMGNEIALLAAHGHAIEHRMLVLIAAFDERRGWAADDQPNCAAWLAHRTGWLLHTCRERVRTARALGDFPLASAAMARGELSFSKLRALTRAHGPIEDEAALVDYATARTADATERLVRSYNRLDRMDENELARRRWEDRTLAAGPDLDGMVFVNGRLSADRGAVVLKALDVLGHALYQGDDGPTPKQRKADALALMAELALWAMEQRDAPVPSTHGVPAGTPAESRAERSPITAGTPTTVVPSTHGVTAGTPAESPAKVSPVTAGTPTTVVPSVHGVTAGTPALATSTARADRFLVMVHVEPATLQAHGEPGRSHLDTGTRVAPETARRLACDASTVEVQHAADGSLLDVGRRTRQVPTRLRRALAARDGGCRFPGCGRRFADAHHIIHWADGGRTSLDNLVLLCCFHHTRVHEGRFRVEYISDTCINFYDPRGLPVREVAPPPALGPDPVSNITAMNRAAGADPGPLTAAARYERDRHVPWELEARAMEALDPG